MNPQQAIDKGLFITFEGPEGSGKSTQIQRLAVTLRNDGYDVLVTREPGGTPLGEQLRNLIKHFNGPGGVCDEAELLMFGASRAQLMQHVVEPHLAGNGIVLCDRFADSTTVYQGAARGLDVEFIQTMHEFTLHGRWPDLTLLLDIDVDEGFRRARSRDPEAQTTDRFEAESESFHHRVREGFRRLAESQSARFRLVNAAETPDQVEKQIREIVYRVLG